MSKNRATRKSSVNLETSTAPRNAKVCAQCGFGNSFKRVKCEKCAVLLPEGNFERSRRMREQTMKREQQLALASTLFSDKPIMPDDTEDHDGGRVAVKRDAADSADAKKNGRKRNGSR